MIKVFLGKVNEANEYHINDIINEYSKALVYIKYSMSQTLRLLPEVYRPIVDKRILFVVKERAYELGKDGKQKLREYKKRDFEGIYEKVKKYEKHPYIDIIWVIENKSTSGFQNLITDMDITYLKDYYKDDVIKYISKDFPKEEVAKHIANRVKFSIEKYKEYRLDLLEYGVELSKNKVSRIINKINMTIPQITEEIAKKHKKGLKEYYSMASRYSFRFVNTEMIKTLDNVMKIKSDILSNKRKLYDALSGDNFKFNYMVKEINIMDIYTLKNLIERNLTNSIGVEMYYQYETESKLELLKILDN